MKKKNFKTTHKTSTQVLWCLLMIVSSSLLTLSESDNSITITNSITTNQTIISEGRKFALGFFTLDNFTSSYLGIWYNTIPTLTLIWVANRSSPIPKGSSPLLKISKDGNLVVLSGKKIVWTSNVPSTSLNLQFADAVLFDNGNFVLRHGENNEVWHSFEHPCDMFVSGMNISSNRRTGEQTRLTSWADDENPQPGIFSIGIDPNRYELYLYKGDKPYWRSNVYAFSSSYSTGFVKFDQAFSAYFSFIVEDDEVALVYSMSSNSVKSRFTLVPTGQIQLMVWVKTTWLVLWQQPLATCDFYGFCGSFTICQKKESIPLCRCLAGFHPKSHNEWSSGNWRGGCVRNNTLECDQGDKFLKFEGVKLPDHAVNTGNKSVNECETECFKNCSCIAYAYENVTSEVKIVCLIWFRELVDITSNPAIGHDLFVRVHDSGPDQHAVDDNQEHNSIRKRKHLIAVAVAVVSIVLLLVSFFGCFWRRKRLDLIL